MADWLDLLPDGSLDKRRLIAVVRERRLECGLVCRGRRWNHVDLGVDGISPGGYVWADRETGLVDSHGGMACHGHGLGDGVDVTGSALVNGLWTLVAAAFVAAYYSSAWRGARRT